MAIESFRTASIWIPHLVEIGLNHSTSNAIGKYNILKVYEESLDLMTAILFYSYLFEKIDTYVYFDEFNWVPMTYDEINLLANLANELKTIAKGKIEVNINQTQIKLIS